MHRLSLELVNSELFDGFGGREDRLDDLEWCAGLLARVNVIERPTARARGLLQDLRSLLRRMVEDVAQDGRARGSDIDALNAYLAAAPTLVRLDPATGELKLEPIGATWPTAIARFAFDFAALLAETDPRRLSVCDNDLCRWAFIDETRNRSRRWCDPAACGNVARVRRHRERRA
jgi:predicted RNA-binding Zn ribbon-like protein